MSFSDDVDDEVGGAIKSVVLRPDEPYFIKKTTGKISSPLDFEPDVTSANILRRESMFESPGLAAHFQSVRDEPPNMIPRVMHPYSSYSHMMQADREEHVTKGIIDGTSGRGADTDHPYIQRAIWETLKHKPELLQIYLAGKA